MKRFPTSAIHDSWQLNKKICFLWEPKKRSAEWVTGFSANSKNYTKSWSDASQLVSILGLGTLLCFAFHFLLNAFDRVTSALLPFPLSLSHHKCSEHEYWGRYLPAAFQSEIAGNKVRDNDFSLCEALPFSIFGKLRARENMTDRHLRPCTNTIACIFNQTYVPQYSSNLTLINNFETWQQHEHYWKMNTND